jgi:hypothetical protein
VRKDILFVAQKAFHDGENVSATVSKIPRMRFSRGLFKAGSPFHRDGDTRGEIAWRRPERTAWCP